MGEVGAAGENGGSQSQWSPWAFCVSCHEEKVVKAKKTPEEVYGDRTFILLPCFHVVCSNDCLEKCGCTKIKNEAGPSGSGGRVNSQKDYASRCLECGDTFTKDQLVELTEEFDGIIKKSKKSVRLRKKCSTCLRALALAKLFCNDCGGPICEKCVEGHTYVVHFLKHSLVESEEMFRFAHPSVVCVKHPEYTFTKHCTTCDLHLCEACLHDQSHHSHETVDFEDYGREAIKKLNELNPSELISKTVQKMEAIQERISSYQKKSREGFMATLAQIDDTFIRIAIALMEREKSVKAEVNAYLAKDTERLKRGMEAYKQLYEESARVIAVINTMKDMSTQSPENMGAFFKLYKAIKEKSVELVKRRIHLKEQFGVESKFRIVDNSEKLREALENLFPRPNANTSCENVDQGVTQNGMTDSALNTTKSLEEPITEEKAAETIVHGPSKRTFVRSPSSSSCSSDNDSEDEPGMDIDDTEEESSPPPQVIYLQDSSSSEDESLASKTKLPVVVKPVPIPLPIKMEPAAEELGAGQISEDSTILSEPPLPPMGPFVVNLQRISQPKNLSLTTSEKETWMGTESTTVIVSDSNLRDEGSKSAKSGDKDKNNPPPTEPQKVSVIKPPVEGVPTANTEVEPCSSELPTDPIAKQDPVPIECASNDNPGRTSVMNATTDPITKQDPVPIECASNDNPGRTSVMNATDQVDTQTAHKRPARLTKNRPSLQQCTTVESENPLKANGVILAKDSSQKVQLTSPSLPQENTTQSDSGISTASSESEGHNNSDENLNKGPSYQNDEISKNQQVSSKASRKVIETATILPNSNGDSAKANATPLPPKKLFVANLLLDNLTQSENGTEFSQNQAGGNPNATPSLDEKAKQDDKSSTVIERMPKRPRLWVKKPDVQNQKDRKESLSDAKESPSSDSKLESGPTSKRPRFSSNVVPKDSENSVAQNQQQATNEVVPDLKESHGQDNNSNMDNELTEDKRSDLKNPVPKDSEEQIHSQQEQAKSSGIEGTSSHQGQAKSSGTEGTSSHQEQATKELQSLPPSNDPRVPPTPSPDTSKNSQGAKPKSTQAVQRSPPIPLGQPNNQQGSVVNTYPWDGSGSGPPGQTRTSTPPVRPTNLLEPRKVVLPLPPRTMTPISLRTQPGPGMISPSRAGMTQPQVVARLSHAVPPLPTSPVGAVCGMSRQRHPFESPGSATLSRSKSTSHSHSFSSESQPPPPRTDGAAHGSGALISPRLVITANKKNAELLHKRRHTQASIGTSENSSSKNTTPATTAPRDVVRNSLPETSRPQRERKQAVYQGAVHSREINSTLRQLERQDPDILYYKCNYTPKKSDMSNGTRNNSELSKKTTTQLQNTNCVGVIVPNPSVNAKEKTKEKESSVPTPTSDEHRTPSSSSDSGISKASNDADKNNANKPTLLEEGKQSESSKKPISSDIISGDQVQAKAPPAHITLKEEPCDKYQYQSDEEDEELPPPNSELPDVPVKRKRGRPRKNASASAQDLTVTPAH